MSLPGRLLLRFNEYRSMGPKAAWYRDVVRPRILRTAPVEGLEDGRVEIHVMTSAADWLNLMWALKTFYAASKRKYALCVHDDGTLPAEALAQLKAHFKPVRIIPRAEADARMDRELASYPKLRDFRRTNLLAPKVTDFAAYLHADRMMLLDSDILFFAKPTALLRHLEDPTFVRNAFNSDCADAYVVTPEATRAHCGVELKPLINSGLGLVHRASIRYDWLEEFLGIPGILDGHFWRIEQQLFALAASKYGVELLPSEYTVDVSAAPAGNRPCRHYIGCIRARMYAEGMAQWQISGGELRRK
jgi:hypothetical protein